ncbi:MAG: MFS transporter [bacterium]|nr:MFS transporter [bacterium]
MHTEPSAPETGGEEPGFDPGPEGITGVGARALATVTAGLVLALFLAVLGQTMLAVAMPDIVEDLGGFHRYSWPLTAYLVASVVAIPIAGRLGDVFGRRPILISGTALIVAGSILAFASQSITQLSGSMAIQGAGAGGIMTASLAAVADLFPPEQRGRYQGMLSAVSAVGLLAGLAVGGIVSDHLSWRWIFAITACCAVPVLLAQLAFPRLEPDGSSRKLDCPGMLALALAVVPVLVAISLAGADYPWRSWQVIGLVVLGSISGVVFVIIETRSDAPIISPAIYRRRPVALSMVIAFLLGSGMYAVFLVVPLFLQSVKGTSASSSGGLLAAMMGGLVVGSIVSGQCLSTANPRYRRHAVMGTSAMTAGVALLSGMDRNTAYGEATAYIIIVGFGIGAALTTATVAVQNFTDRSTVGIATSALQFWRTISGTLGLAVLGAILRAAFATNLERSVAGGTRAALSPGQFEAIRRDPQNYIGQDPVAVPEFAATAGDPDVLTAQLLEAVNSSLGRSISIVLAVCAALVGLSVVAALSLRPSRGAPG